MLACLLLSQIACSARPVAVRTETVEVEVPVVVKVDPGLTRVDPEPADPGRHCSVNGRPTVCNGDLVEWAEAVRAWGRGLAARLWNIATTHGEQP